MCNFVCVFLATSHLNCGKCGNKCAFGEKCVSGKCRKPIGKICTYGSDCISGFCHDKLCCNKSCSGPCRTCKAIGWEGICRNHKAGTNPEKGCGTYNCNGLGACYSGCVKTSSCGAPYCRSDAWCFKSKCQSRFSSGHSCVYACSCKSGTCKLFKCK